MSRVDIAETPHTKASADAMQAATQTRFPHGRAGSGRADGPERRHARSSRPGPWKSRLMARAWPWTFASLLGRVK